MVAVRQVSEGVDLPRLAVCLWATSYRTPLFFAQAVGRIVRSRSAQETATVFLPAVRPLLSLAADMEQQRNYAVRVVSADDTLDGTVVERVAPSRQDFEALEADAEFAHLLHAGQAFRPPAGLDDATTEFLGLPGLLSPAQTAALLAARDSGLRRTASTFRLDPDSVDDVNAGAPPPQTWREVEALRREVSKLVAQAAARTGRRHAELHLELRTAVPGPPSASAPVDVLIRRRDNLLAGH
jgi:hypothetical protein